VSRGFGQAGSSTCGRAFRTVPATPDPAGHRAVKGAADGLLRHRRGYCIRPTQTVVPEQQHGISAASWSTPPPAKLLRPPRRIGFFAKPSSAYDAAARATEWAAASRLDRTLLKEWVPLPFRCGAIAPDRLSFSVHGGRMRASAALPQVRTDNPRSRVSFDPPIPGHPAMPFR